MNIITRLAACMCAALSIVALSTSAAIAADLDKLTLAYSSNVQGPDSTFLFAGKQLGFFEDEGIDLEIQVAGGTTAAAGLVASGVSDLALGGLEAMPGYVERGVPMKAVFVYAYRPIFSLAFLTDSEVKSIEDLRGAKVGVLSLSSGAIPVLQYIVKEAGMEMSDIQLVPVGMGAAAISAIEAGDVDALMFFDTGYASFEANGLSLIRYSSPRLDMGYPGQGIYALQTTIDGRGDEIERFLRALTRSLKFAIESPRKATEAFAELHPEVGTNMDLMEALWRERIKISEPSSVDGQPMWGHMGTEGWENLLEVLSIGDLIEQKPAIEDLYTEQFLDAANETAE